MRLKELFCPLYRNMYRCHRFAHSKACPDEYRQFYLYEPHDFESFLDKTEIVSLDFETTGLDAKKDHLLSAGGISIIKGCIDFNSAFHFFVNNSEFIKEDSALINHITPEKVLKGKSEREAVTELFERLSGKIVLTHCAFIETSFLKAMAGLKKNAPLPFYVIDTMAIERRLLRLDENPDLRLFAIRKRRALPDYEAHNALSDSLATAEVFLAQLKDIFGKDRPELKKLKSYL